MGVSKKQNTPNFPKHKHFLPPDTHTIKGHTYLNKLAAESCKFFLSMYDLLVCAYQGVRNVPFSENLACFVFLKHPF